MKCKTVLLIAMFVVVGSLLSAQGLKVEPGTSIKVELGSTLDISGGGDLTLKSDATGDASLIDLGSVAYTGGGEANVERYLTNGQWHLISSPITNALGGMFVGDYIQSYAEATDIWTDITSLSEQLSPMQGYSLWSMAGTATTEVFSGITNTGSQSMAFTYSGALKGYNLMGNPYPSVLDWDEVAIPSELNGTFHLFDPTIGSNGDYVLYLKGATSGNTTSQYIPSGQGFFVRATGTGTLALDNSDRGYGVQPFYKNTEVNHMLVLKATGNNITTQTAIRFNPNATAQVDRLYDAHKMMSNSTDVPILYTKCNGENMAINTLPSVSGNETVPLYFEAGQSGNYTFQATELQSIDPNIPVYLEDVAQNYVQDLRTNPEYLFAYTTGAVKNFNIHFENTITQIEEPKDLNVTCYLANNTLYVNFLTNEAPDINAKLEVYSVLGQQLLKQDITQKSNAIPLVAKQALYLIHIVAEDGTFATKVFNQ